MNIRKYIIIIAVLFAAVSCGGKREVMEPEAVVEAFSRAVAAGDFEAARALCDTLTMEPYIENYKKVMGSLQKEDSAAVAIAASILAGADFEVIGVEKKGDERHVHYQFAAVGSEKAKVATVKKEEGEWRVTGITDAI